METMICPECFSATLKQTRKLNIFKCSDCNAVFVLKMIQPNQQIAAHQTNRT